MSLHIGPSIHSQELEKYKAMWAIPAYAKHSPGEKAFDIFEEVAEPHSGETVVDLGAGSGKGSLKLERAGLTVTQIDLTLDAVPKAQRNRFRGLEVSLWDQWVWASPLGYDYGYCTDVMEHIPPEYTMLVLDRIIENCRASFFQIALVPDQFGQRIGQTLHLTVRPFVWWRDRLAEFGNLVEARDMIDEGVFYVTG